MLIDRKILPVVVIVLLFMLYSFYVVAWTIPERDNEQLSIRSQTPFEVYFKNKEEPFSTYALPSNSTLKSKSNAFMIVNNHSNMSSDTFSLSDPARNNMAIRLTFSYEGNDIKLISKQNIEKVLQPPSLQSHIQQGQTGSWYELSDENQRLLHRQIIDNPIKVDAEVFSDTESISRVKLSEIRGTFSIVVPNIPESKNFDLFSSPVISEGIRGLQKPATKIFHLDLK